MTHATGSFSNVCRALVSMVGVLVPVLIGWLLHAMFAFYIAMFPQHLIWPAIFVAILTLVKCTALYGGIRWLLSGDRLPDTVDVTSYEQLVRAFAKCDETLTPFGITDARLRLQIFELGRRRKWLATLAIWLRDTLFGFNSLAVFGAITLSLWPLRDGQFSGDKVVAISLISVLLVMTLLMGLEVLIGQTMLRKQYSFCMHFAACNRPELAEKEGKGLLLLYEMKQTLIFAVCTVVCGAAVFWSGFSLWGGFDEVSTCRHITSASIGTCIAGYFEFLYFALTTFTTVGFDDIAPTSWWSRTIVCYFELLGLGYILFLVNIVVGSSGDGDSFGNDQSRS